MTEVVVRAATVDDLPAVARIRVHSWQAGYAGILPAAFLDELSVADDLNRRREFFARDSSTVETLVAELDATVVGFASFGPLRREQKAFPNVELDDREGEIYALYVEPAHWGAGVGRALIAAALDRLAARPLAPVRLWVFLENARARRFYAAAGFAPDGASALYTRGGVSVPEVRYTRG